MGLMIILLAIFALVIAGIVFFPIVTCSIIAILAVICFFEFKRAAHVNDSE